MPPKHKVESIVAGKVDRTRVYDKVIVFFRNEEERGLFSVHSFEAYPMDILRQRTDNKVPAVLLKRNPTDADRKVIYWYTDRAAGKQHVTAISVFARIEKGN